ncbi:MAG: hypothetical protein Q8K74_00765 [Candidatus Nitrotoga sp.]|nr:hypothetical protein [Candidatus Nitrotoga sp.]MDP1854573.1 hypothetical protein [Candidatus Nitrotoga sp.]
MNQRVPSAIYSKEFREQTVKQVTEEELSPKEAARRLSMSVKKTITKGMLPHEQSIYWSYSVFSAH